MVLICRRQKEPLTSELQTISVSRSLALSVSLCLSGQTDCGRQTGWLARERREEREEREEESRSGLKQLPTAPARTQCLGRAHLGPPHSRPKHSWFAFDPVAVG